MFWKHCLRAKHPVLVYHPYDVSHLLLQTLVLHLLPLHVLTVLIHQVLSRPLLATCSGGDVCHSSCDVSWWVLFELGVPDGGGGGVDFFLEQGEEPSMFNLKLK